MVLAPWNSLANSHVGLIYCCVFHAKSTKKCAFPRVLMNGRDHAVCRWCGWTTLLTEEFVEYGTYYMQVSGEARRGQIRKLPFF